MLLLVVLICGCVFHRVSSIKYGYECDNDAECEGSTCENLWNHNNYAFCGACVADADVAVSTIDPSKANDWHCCSGYYFARGGMFMFDHIGHCKQSTFPSPYSLELTVVSVVVLFLFVYFAYRIGYRRGEKKIHKSVSFNTVASDASDTEDEEIQKPFVMNDNIKD
eukprot:UN02245